MRLPRSRQPVSAIFVLAALLLTACDPPPAPEVTEAPAGDEAAPAVLPGPVIARREQLLDIAETGGPWDMARVAGETPDFRSNTGGMPHRDYWYLKYRTGDWPMAQMGRVLSWPHATEETPEGRVFVWPYMARLSVDQIDARTARDIENLAGSSAVEAMLQGAPWPGYSLGIREDGAWLFFVSGVE